MKLDESMELSEDQQKAYWKIANFIANDKPKSQLSLGGYAGTGKTTLIKEIIENFPAELRVPKITVLSLTGKAVSVLQSKNIDAATIHSTIYYPPDEDRKQSLIWRRKPKIRTDIIIVDEASMVSDQLYKDLIAFHKPILWVGDHGQLEPVGKNPGLMLDPDIRLEKIHRQAQGNPIIALADEVRKGAAPTLVKLPDSDKVVIKKKRDLTIDELVESDQIICALNGTRVKINNYVRGLQNKPQGKVVEGDKMICLKNNRKEGLFNGMQGLVLDCKDREAYYEVEIKLDTGGRFHGCIAKAQINLLKGLSEYDEERPYLTHWDFGYAITCHKAQGSEWNDVLVIDEPMKFKLWSMNRWRYTAITRAAEKLVFAVQ